MERVERAEMMRDTRRSRLIDAAVAIALETGWLSIRQAAVAKRAGMAKGLVTHEFGTMEALRSAVMERAVTVSAACDAPGGSAEVAAQYHRIVADGLAYGHPVARDAPADLRRAAVASIV